jgi:hypothetical protein
LTTFIAFLEFRVPNFRQANHEIAQHLFDLMAKASVGTAEGFNAVKQGYETKTGKVLDITYEQAKGAIESGELVVDLPRTHDIKMMVEGAPAIANIIRQMSPSLLVATDRGKFITGDVPIYKFDLDDVRREQGIEGVGWATPEVEITVPLTSRYCLLLTHFKNQPIFELGNTDVGNVNFFRVASATQYLFAASADFPVSLDRQNLLWGDQAVLDHFAQAKQHQPAVGISWTNSSQATNKSTTVECLVG